jgi:hypothetical protein
MEKIVTEEHSCILSQVRSKHSSLSSRFNPVPAGVGVIIPSIMMFKSVLYNGGYVGCYAGGISELFHKCVI